MMKAYEDANYALCKKDNEDWTTASCSSKAATYCGLCSVAGSNDENSCNNAGTCSTGSCAGDSGSCTSNCGTCSDSQYTSPSACSGQSGTWTAATWTAATWTAPAANDICCSEDGQLECKGTGPKECCSHCVDPGHVHHFDCTFSTAYDNYGPAIAVCGTTGSSCSSCTWTHGGTSYAISAESEDECTGKGLCLDGSGNPMINIWDSDSCASDSGTWVGGVFTVLSANANNEYACHGNSWIKSCYRCTGNSADSGSPDDAPNCIKYGGTWALDAASTTESLCEAGSQTGRSFAFANHFEGGQTVAGASVSDGGIMQVGQSCSTGPSYTLEANSCIKDTTFDADIDAGTTGSAAYAANVNYYSGMNAGAGKT